jgi:signal transduction histidine kinase
MVYRIIQLHDGDVEVESTPGRGTTFRVLLPRAHES